MKIYFEEDSLEAEEECAMKGCRLDVLVQENGKFYRPIIYTNTRLSHECNAQLEKNKYYIVKQNYIVVSTITKDNIISALVELQKGKKYFDNLQCVDLQKEYADCFQELQDINNWTQVY